MTEGIFNIDMKITLAHGSGGKYTSDLINSVFESSYGNEVLAKMEDSAVVDGYKKIAVTTDSFVVNPLFFKGGNIGRLSVCGTVNDLLMRGAVPKYITSAFIIEEGADSEDLKKIAQSMADTAKEAGVIIVAGDTKVIEGSGGVYINTAGVGFVENDNICSSNCRAGDKIILSGNLGDHHAVILSSRMNIDNSIESDNAPLIDIVSKLLDNKIDVHCMRDVTRGGLGTVLNELAEASDVKMNIFENDIPVDSQVKAFADFLGLEIMHMGNEGKMIAVVSADDSEKALDLIRGSAYGENAQIIGEVKEGSGVVLNTSLGGQRIISVLRGEGLPRIC